MPRNKGIGRKCKRKRDTSSTYLRPKGKQKLETTGRAEEPCNVDSDDEEFSDCDDGFGVVINDEMRHKITRNHKKSTTWSSILEVFFDVLESALLHVL